MKHFVLFFLLVFTLNKSYSQDSAMVRKIYDEALVNGQSYKNLEYLCKKIGHRLSGSPGAAKSVNWTKSLMQSYGFDKVYLQEVMVPHWVRGPKETAKIINSKQPISVSIAALGGSVGTKTSGLTAEVIEVQSLKELAQLGEAKIKGKIVFFNRPFDPRPIEAHKSYGLANDQRNRGPAEAAKYGAAGAIVRSLTHTIDDYPHTGATKYAEGGNKIPAAAISTKGAETLSKLLKNNPKLKFFFKQSCQILPDVLSYNVIGEITGSENPASFITVGAHLDSWDLAEGAHDDGTGVMQSIEVLRIFKTIGYKPKNTIRAVLFMNEENGLKGGYKYAEQAKLNNEKHIAAMESDEGGFTPRGFGFEAPNELIENAASKWNKVLAPYLMDHLVAGYGGADIGPLKKLMPDVVLIGLQPDSQRYYDVHHAATDVFERVNKRELELGGAGMASLIYLIDSSGF